MDTFSELRKQAAEKRDRAIRCATEEYETALVRIAELEQMIKHDVPVGKLTIAQAIEKAMPTDRPFTTQDIMAGLRALDPNREWRARSIDNHMVVLRRNKKVRRLRKNGVRRRALYVRTGVKIPSLPFEGMPLVDVIETVLDDSDRGLTQTELAVNILESGYATEQKPEFFRDYIGRQLSKHQSRFTKHGRYWTRK